MELREIHHFLGHDAGRHNTQGEPSAEMAAAAGVVEAAVLEVGGEVGMSRTGMLAELLIVLAAGVLVAEKEGERRPCGMPVINARHDFRKVGLDAGRGAGGSGLAAGQVFCKIRFPERNAGQDAVKGYADMRAVGLTKNTDSEFIAKCVHSLSNISLKAGKDLDTQAVSSMTTGESAPREATLRAMTMRWSP